jgi:hypothetical protein
MPSGVTRSITRKGFLTRFGVAIVGASASSVLASRRRAFAVVPFAPACCYGLDQCGSGNCPSSPQGNCCWYCNKCTNGRAQVYQCCDQYPSSGSCICAYYVGSSNFC